MSKATAVMGQGDVDTNCNKDSMVLHRLRFVYEENGAKLHLKHLISW